MKKFLLQVFLICVVSFIIVLGLDFVSAISTGTALTPADLVKIDIQKETLSPTNTSAKIVGSQIVWQITFLALEKQRTDYVFNPKQLEYRASLYNVIIRFLTSGFKALDSIKQNIVLQVQSEIFQEKNRIQSIQEKLMQDTKNLPFTEKDLEIGFN